MYTEEQLKYIRFQIAYILDTSDNEALNIILTEYPPEIEKYEKFLNNDAEKYFKKDRLIRILLAIPMFFFNPRNLSLLSNKKKYKRLADATELMKVMLKYAKFIRATCPIINKKLHEDDSLTEKVWDLIRQYYILHKEKQGTVFFKDILRVCGIEMIKEEAATLFNCNGLFDKKIYAVMRRPKTVHLPR